MSVSLKCEARGCAEIKTADDIGTCIALMQLHQKNVHESADNSRQKPPQINRPTLAQAIGEDEWAAFTRRWTVFKNGTDLSHSNVIAQLIACCEPELEATLFRGDAYIADKTEEEVLASMKRLAVLSVALSTRRSQLLQTRQDSGEPVRQYVARLRGMANVCQWTKSGKCSTMACDGVTSVDYTEDIVKLILINGISDETIRKEVLGLADIDGKSLSDVVAIIDSKEIAARAISVDGFKVAASAYKRQSTTLRQPSGALPGDSDATKKQFQCQCGRQTPRSGIVRGKLKQFTTCLDCWKKTRLQERTRNLRKTSEPLEAMYQHVTAIETPALGQSSPITNSCHRDTLSIAGQRVFDSDISWYSAEARPHPTVDLLVSVDTAAYEQSRLQKPPSRSTRIAAVADSGAQVCLLGLPILRRLKLHREHLSNVTKRVIAANGDDINILGAILLRLSGRDANDKEHHTSVVAFVTDSTDRFYISRAAMVGLGIVGEDFPRIGSTVAATATAPGLSSTSATASCGCPVRITPPGCPVWLPFTPSVENCDKMKAWLVERYSSSTLNTCPHQPLPAMTGPPMAIRVNENTTPTVTRRPPNVPVHWQDEVAKQLERDVALGVIERVPPNTPVTWLHNMVVTSKHDGSPRRTIDLQPLNRHSVRETHHTIPPAKQARSIPPGVFKTVTDAWNGYHSIEIRPEDRHKTTFLTEQGRYRYKRAPMGFLASQDAYTERYDTIIADVPRKSKCIDDVIIWDDDLESHWWRVIDYMERVGRAGVILNPLKLQFSDSEVDFAGFRITCNEVRPLPKYLDAIASFPRPTNITDVRAWFGLVNQVSHYGRTTDMMVPFKQLLSPKTRFQWGHELEEAFQRSKSAIITAITDGVEIFDPRRQTCLNPDWSRTGIGYWLRQKHCTCTSNVPGCCPDGWRVTLAGSRFLRPAETRYAPIEGEALAVAWALEDSRFFTLGCQNLIITTDHKPLVKILSDRSLDDITNPRIFRLKQRTLMWRYRITHVPGKDIPAADATSRHPAPPSGCHDDTSDIRISSGLSALRICSTEHDDFDSVMVASAKCAAGSLGAITWERVRNATASDGAMEKLASYIWRGFPGSREDVPEELQPFWQHRHDLYTVDDVVMLGGRIVIPPSLRNEVLRVLHAAHQGCSRMYSRAQQTVFWPGLSKDIENTRHRCCDCWRTSPSQPRMPPVPPTVPTRPFEAIAADFFTTRGVGYLVIVDRFSGWPHIVASASGSKGFKRALVSYFSTFGVPRELSTDGGPEFTAGETTDLLKRWGVHHRLSSAYHAKSNGRAEVAVKSMKRLLMSLDDTDGGVSSESVAAGLLQYRNTPDPETGVSPAQVVFGRSIHDLLPVAPSTTVFNNDKVHPVWRDTWERQEEALRLRFAKQTEKLRPHSRRQIGIEPGARVLVQNQTGPHAKRWDRSGVVVEARPNDQYLVKVDGSGRVTLRNRQYLRQVEGLRENANTVPTALPSVMDTSPASDRPLPAAPHPDQNNSSGTAPTAPPSAMSAPPACDSTPSAGIHPELDTTNDTPRTNVTQQQAGHDGLPPRDVPAADDALGLRRPKRERRPPARFQDYVSDF